MHSITLRRTTVRTMATLSLAAVAFMLTISTNAIDCSSLGMCSPGYSECMPVTSYCGLMPYPTPAQPPDKAPPDFWCAGLCATPPDFAPPNCGGSNSRDVCNGLDCGGKPPSDPEKKGGGSPPPPTCMGMDCGAPFQPRVPGVGGGTKRPPVCNGMDCGGPAGGSGGHPGKDQPNWSLPGSARNLSAPTTTWNPVNIAYGHKQEMDVDLVVPLQGDDFELARTYVSTTMSGNGGGMPATYFGRNWQLNVGYSIAEMGYGHNELQITCLGTGTATFLYDIGDSLWHPTGTSEQYIQADTLTIDLDGSGTKTYPVYKLVEPGAWTAYFGRIDGTPPPGIESIGQTSWNDGLLFKIEDIYGNTKSFKYFDYGSSGAMHRLQTITCTPAGGGATSGALIQFSYFSHGYAVSELADALRYVTVQRHDGTTWTDVQQVEYVYQKIGDNPDLGTARDLVQVIKSTLLDRGGWYEAITQYRYHRYEESANYTEGEDVDEFYQTGAPHQLKAVFLPEQIEFAAEQYNAESGHPNLSLRDYADHLLTLDDAGGGGKAFGSTNVMSLAAKVISSYETSGDMRVLTQFIQSSCGCGGSSQGTRFDYEYWNYSSSSDGQIARATKVTASDWDGVSATNPRNHYYDLVQYTDGSPSSGQKMYYLANDVAEDEVSSSNRWVTVYEYETASSNPRVKYIYTPAAVPPANYTVGTSSTRAVAVTDSTYGSATGLVYEFAYDSQNHVTDSYVLNGVPGVSGGTRTQVTKNTWGNGTGDTRTYLLNKTENYRVASPSGDDDKEAIEYTYKFHSGTDKLKCVETVIEAELTGENGPSGTGNKYYSDEYFESDGLNTWSRRPDGELVKRTFDANTGALLTITENSDTTGAPTPPSGIQGTITGTSYSDGGSLTTTYAYDLLGRLRSITSPSGKITRYVRERANTSTLQPFENDRNNFTLADTPYLVFTVLPHHITGSDFDGPAYVTTVNAAGKTIQASTFSLASSEDPDYDDIGYAYSLDEELSRSTAQYHLSGLVETTTGYHSLNPSVGENGGKYVTGYEYDSRGRLKALHAPNGTITQYSYDVMNRVIKIETGTDNSVSTSNMLEVVENFFDGGGSAAQGVGNGNLTWVKQYVVDASDTRDTKYTYDYRDRLVKIENPDKPSYGCIEYDNLNRAVKAAMFKSNPSSVSSPVGDRGVYVEAKYSQRGLLYERKLKVHPELSDGTDGDYLSTFLWYDAAGRRIESWDASLPASKIAYDGLGRVKTAFTTDRHDDHAPGNSSSYAEADDVSGDVVFEQTTYSYTSGGLNDLITHRMRTHDAADAKTGDLASFTTSPDDKLVIRMFQGFYYDDADRIIRSVDFGTNSSSGFIYGGTVPTINQASPLDHTSLGGELVTEFVYDNRGRVETVTDPKGLVTKTLYDDLNRAIATIENYKDAALASTPWNSSTKQWDFTGINSANPDEDRVTAISYLITDSPRQVKQIAYTSNTAGQMTRYVYGATNPGSPTWEDSLINTNDWVTMVVYPDVESSLADYSTTVAYNRLGEPRYSKDQNGTKHQLTMDKMGRITVDYAKTIPSSVVDNAIDAIRIAYDDFGRVDTVGSNNGYTSESSQGTVKNQIKFEYTSLWQISNLWQQHDGVVVTSGSPSPKVSYAYALSSSTTKNFSRPTSMTYPNASYALPYEYGTTGSSSDLISRVTGIDIHGGANGAVDYSYIGVGLPAIVDMAGPSGRLDVQLDRSVAHNGTRHSGEYPAFDRFGRVVSHMWVDGGFTTGSGGNSNMPAIVEITHSYDVLSNPLARLDGRKGASRPNRDFQYTYDALSRLTQADRGASGGSFTFDSGTTYNGSMHWTLDFLGNWKTQTIDQDANGAGGGGSDTVQNRDHNDVNELTGIDTDNNTGNGYELAVTHDKVGNLSERRLTNSGTIKAYRYVHDAWGRLVKVQYVTNAGGGGSEIVKDIDVFEYNGLSWRIVKKTDTTATPDSLDQMTVMIYDAAWQLLEERIDDSWNGTFAADKIYQTIYGLRYIDDVICRRQDNDADASYTDVGSVTYYQLSDDQFSTVAVLDSDADLVERIDYDAYGEARHHWLADVDGDGDQDGTDRGIIHALIGGSGTGIGSSSYKADCDIDRSGTINSTDYGLASATNSALAMGRISNVANVFGFSNYVLNAESNAGFIYTVRFRHYDTTLGRWLERDPLRYADGMSMYGYVRGMPIAAMDPYGLLAANFPVMYPMDGGGGCGGGVMGPQPISSPLGPSAGGGGGGEDGSGGGTTPGLRGLRKPPPVTTPPGYGLLPTLLAIGAPGYSDLDALIRSWGPIRHIHLTLAESLALYLSVADAFSEGLHDGWILAVNNFTGSWKSDADAIRAANADNDWYTAGDWTSWLGGWGVKIFGPWAAAARLGALLPAYHYTSAAGAASISEQGIIWGSETIYGARVYTTILPPAIVQRYPWLIGRTFSAEVAEYFYVFGTTEHWVPWVRILPGHFLAPGLWF